MQKLRGKYSVYTLYVGKDPNVIDEVRQLIEKGNMVGASVPQIIRLCIEAVLPEIKRNVLKGKRQFVLFPKGGPEVAV